MRKEDYAYDKHKSNGVLFFSASSVGDTRQLVDFGIREILVSYFYIKKSISYYEETARFLRKEGGLFMTDSGAFSFMGGEMKDEMYTEAYWLPYLEEYVAWLKKNKEYIYVAANLDLDVVVGRDVVRKWNKKYFEPLEKEGLQIVYVAHEDECGDPHAIQHFKEYCAKYKYVGINQRHKEYASRFYQIAKMYHVRVHGFAWTELGICKKYPFFSNDSSVSASSMVMVKDSNDVIHNIAIGKLFKMFPVTTKRNYEKRSVTSGWKTLTLDSENKIIWAEMSSVIQHTIKKQMYRLFIEGGIILEVTKDHSIIQLNKDGSSKEVLTETLKEGDYVLSPKKIPFSKKKVFIDDTFLEFLGLWVGDGHFTKGNSYHIGMSCYNTLETQNIINSIASRFKAKVTPNSNGVDCSISSNLLYKTMRDMGFKGKSHTKRVPSFIFGLSKKQICSFLRGYFSADGTGEGLGFSTVSKGLCSDLVTLLNGMGILTSVTFYKKRFFFKDGKKYKKRASYGVQIKDTISRKVFLDNIDFCIAYKHNALFMDILKMKGKEQVWAKKSGVPVELSLTGRVSFKRDNPRVSSLKKTQKRVNRERNFSNFSEKIINNDLIYSQILRIEKLPIEEIMVYDLEVPGHEKFIANNVVVHNTTWLGGVRYGTTYDYDGKNFRTIDYTKKHTRKAKRIKYERHAGIKIEDVTKREDRVSINRMNLLGWLGFRREYIKMANLKLHSKKVAEYERKY